MTSLDFEVFVELLSNLEPLLSLTIQPAVISALGYKLFAVSFKVLCGEMKGLKEVVKQSLQMLNKHVIRDALASSVKA